MLSRRVVAAPAVLRPVSAGLLSTASVRVYYSSDKKSKSLWGGRFSKNIDPRVFKWTDSIPVDRNLTDVDLWGSQAHTTMLGVQGIIPASDAGKILGALYDIQKDYADGKLQLGEFQDDVHMDNEARLTKIVGPVGGRMHTTRSRNDQVVLDSKLYTRNRLLELRKKVIIGSQAFLNRARNHLTDVMPSYTHVQHAQPVSVAFWLSHYAAVFQRDSDRLKRAYDLTDQNPLGGGAIAGTSFPIDRKLTSSLMGFQTIHEHSMDATSARDFMLETLAANAILMTTYSRLAEELILWSSYEFGTVTLDDGFAMGSSMMPQKKNPGPCELLRGRAGRISGLMNAGLTMMKGLPSGYNRDFHEDKEILVESLNIVNDAAEIIEPLITSTTINFKRMADIVNGNFATATELANYLVKDHAVPFRDAHHVVGSLVGDLSRAGKNFTDFDACMAHLKKHKINAPAEEVRAVLDAKSVMMSYNSLGGTGPKAVTAMLDQMDKRNKALQAELDKDQARLDKAHEAARTIANEARNAKTVDDLKAIVKKHQPKN